MQITPLFGLVAVVASWAGMAPAQDVEYTFSGRYAASTALTAQTAPNAAFTFAFLVPESVVNFTAKDAPFSVQAPVLSGFYTFGGNTTAVVSGSYDFESSAGNQTDLRLNLFTGDAVELWARALSPGTLGVLAQRPDTANLSHFRTGDLGTQYVQAINFSSGGPAPWTTGAFGNITGAVVPIRQQTATIAPVPEPSSIALTGLGLTACGAIFWARRRGPLAVAARVSA